MPRLKSQSFNDGVCELYSVQDIAVPGKKPIEQLVIKGRLRYEERTVGMNRYTNFLQSDVEVSRIIRVLRKIEVSTQDVAIPIDGHQYRIVQVQYPMDTVPKCMDLSLERIETIYGKS